MQRKIWGEPAHHEKSMNSKNNYITFTNQYGFLLRREFFCSFFQLIQQHRKHAFNLQRLPAP